MKMTFAVIYLRVIYIKYHVMRKANITLNQDYTI